MSISISKVVPEILISSPEQRFTAKEIAVEILKRHPEACAQKQAKSKAKKVPINSDEKLISQLVAEIGSQRPMMQKKFPSIRTSEDKPRKYYFSEKTDEQLAEEEPSATFAEDGITGQTLNAAYSEKDLYPLLSKFLIDELDVLSMRIDEKKAKHSKGAGGNKWLFPDIVGMEPLSLDWGHETKAFAKESGAEVARLWSFEVKRVLNPSNVRECYFQAISNSSWANYGYLVAHDISEGIRGELQILSDAHGIGIIRLVPDNPSESVVMIPAQFRASVDLNLANRLSQESTDFRRYIKLVRQFYQTGEAHVDQWDCSPTSVG